MNRTNGVVMKNSRNEIEISVEIEELETKVAPYSGLATLD